MASIRPVYIDPAAISVSDLDYLSEAPDGEVIVQGCGGTGQNASSNDDLLTKLGLYTANVVKSTKLPDAGASKGAIVLGTDLGNSASFPNVVGLKGKILPSLTTGFLKYNGSAWEFDTSSGTGNVNVAGSGHTDNMVVYSNDAGTTVVDGPPVNKIKLGTLITGAGLSSMATTLDAGTKGLALVSDPYASRGLKYDYPYPIEFGKKHFGIQALAGSPNFHIHGTNTQPIVQGVATAVSDAQGDWVKLTDASGTGYLGVIWPQYNICRYAQTLAYTVKFKFENTLGQIMWLGFVDTSPTGSSTPVASSDYAAMTYPGGDNPLTPYTSIGSGGNTSGTPSSNLATGTVYTVTILVKSSTCEFYFNDRSTYLVSIGTTQPAGACSPVIILKSSTTAKSLYIHSMDIYGG